MRACFTGHRPRSFPWRYNEQDERCVNLKRVLRAVIVSCIEGGVKHFITGMALGVDTWAAEIVLSLKTQYPHITLEAAIPHLKQESRWPEESQKRYWRILGEADKVTVVTKAEYAPRLMMIRNEYMIDNADYVIGIYNGSSTGGTKHALDYAVQCGKHMIIIHPETLLIEEYKNGEKFNETRARE